MSTANPDLDGIAIIGMALRVPGARDVETFWANLLAGVSSIRRSDEADLRAAGFGPEALSDPDLVRAFGELDGIAEFDAAFFGYPPARAEALDPQQRLLLETAWHALEHAGHAPGSQPPGTHRPSIGTYLSITQSTYRPASDGDGEDAVFALTSRDKDYAASRVAHKLDLTGPAMMIQSASSGSLAAVHAAVESLVSGQCDVALAGGASIALPQGAYRYTPGLMLSRSGTCRAFDARADGAVPGNGVGIVVLKPLADALADRDTVYAVIRGSALNNDGADKSDYLAPSVAGQARVVGEALAVAGIAAESVGYIETHGTGTLIGDPIEIRGLARVFRREAMGGRQIALGTLKPNIGHLHVASGVAGLIKAALAVHHGELPPSIGYGAPNPEATFEDTPFAINTQRRAWPDGGPRRAGVSAFGLGGTNVHVVLEEAPAHASRAGDGPVRTQELPLLLSAKTADGLVRARSALAAHLRRAPPEALADIAFTLAAGRQHFSHRAAIVCASPQAGASGLEAGAGADPATAGAFAEPLRRWLAGAAVDWRDAFAGLNARRVAVPLYPFAPEHHWSEAPAVSPTSAVTEAALAPTVAAASAGDAAPQGDLLAWLGDEVGAILHKRREDLDPDTTYEAFGIDSLLVNTITRTLQRRFPDLAATALFEHRTLRALAAHLAQLEPSSAEPVATPGERVAIRPQVAAQTAIATPARTGAVAEARHDDPIAIIGMAGRYPGGADPDAFWAMLEAGRSAIGEVPAARWDWRDHVDPAGERKDRSYTRFGGFIEGVDTFDPLFFGISPREAKLLDPQQRLMLQTVWAAIEHAGTTRAALKESAGRGDVGVFIGAMHDAYRLLAMDAVDAGYLVQANHWSIANRISYQFDFAGPSLAVDTACSASLAAIHLAVASLRRGECGAAIAGGVSLVLSPQQPLELCRAGMLSRGAECSAFGAGADGFVHGEGVGAVVLKPLSAALADNDRVLAVIRGSAMNAGGKTAGYTVPNPTAQAGVVEAAIRDSGVDPDTIGYVECHGTGTSLGDPIELSGLAEAFRRVGRGKVPCAVGSVKSNIGHLEAAAGIAGLAKLVMQLERGTLVASLNATEANPKIDFSAGPFAVQQSAAPWPSLAGGRRAGISSFGAGGANVHLVVEEAPELPVTTPAAGPWVVPLSARTGERLAVLAGALRSALAHRPFDVADVAFTLAVGREAMEARRALIVRDEADLLAQLADLPPPAPTAEPHAASLTDALARRDLKALAGHWANGATIDWAPLYAGQTRRRLALPTYPFLAERHWLPELPAADRGASRPAPTGLLAAPVPTLAAEARWTVAVPRAASILADHVVAGEPTLPGVASIVMIAEAAAQLHLAGPVCIRGLTWLRPLVADGEGVEAEVGLRPSADGLEFELCRGGIVHARARVTAEGAATSGGSARTNRTAAPNGAPNGVPAAAGMVERSGPAGGAGASNGAAFASVSTDGAATLSGTAAANGTPFVNGTASASATANGTPSANGAASTSGMTSDGSAANGAALGIGRSAAALAWRAPTEPAARLYGRLEARGLAYGTAFRTIDRWSASGATAQAEAAASDLFPGLALDPGLLDAALQLTASLIDVGPPTLMLPFSVDRVEIHGPTPPRCRLMARRLDDGTEPGIARFDVAITHPDGTPAITLNDLAGRVRNTVLVPPCYAPVWAPTDAPASKAAAPNPAAPEPAARGTRAAPARTAHYGDADHPLAAALNEAMPDALRMPMHGAADLGADHVVISCAETPGALDDVFRLVQDLARGRAMAPLRLTLLGAGAEPTPWVAAAMGLARVAGHECPGWSVHCAWLEDPADLPAALADPGDPGGHELAWRGGRRHARRLVPSMPLVQSPAFKRGGVYLILGGAGGIGLALAEHLVRDVGAKVALVGRTGPDGERAARIAALGEAARFFAADACRAMDMRRAVAEARAALGPIDGAIHSAIVMHDQSLERMSAATFHAALDVKAAGSVNLVDALADAPPQWLAFFSSANSFAANAGQANYVAGCAFKDAYAAYAQARLGCRVRVVNWGLWGEVGRVADPAYQERLRRRGVHPIGTAEGLAAVEQVIGGDVPQVLVLKAEDHVLDSLGLAGPDPEGAAHPAELAPPPPATPGDEDAAAGLAEHAALDRLTRRVAAAALAETGLTAATVAPRHQRLFAALSELIGRAEAPVPSRREVGTEAETFARTHPDLAPHVRLLTACVDAYGEVLRDRRAATEVMFPGSSMALVEGIYRGDRLTGHCNALVAQAVRAAAAARSGAPVSILEVGAGTGGTSAAVLAALEGIEGVRYLYTDVSRAFALHGEKHFGPDHPFVEFGVYDLARDPEAQGYGPASFDIIVGANCVHVTPDLRETIGRLRRLLRADGELILYEMTALPDFVTATFGLLDGWWAFTDRRLPHAPLLDPPGWRRLLREAGFHTPTMCGLGGADPDELRHAVIVARAGEAEVSLATPVAAEPAGRVQAPAAGEGDRAGLVAAVREVVAETLQMQLEQLAVDRNFADYGADSIISVDLIAALSSRFAITLKPTILFSHPTVERLADHLAERHDIRVPAPGGGVTGSTTAPAQPHRPRAAVSTGTLGGGAERRGEGTAEPQREGAAKPLANGAPAEAGATRLEPHTPERDQGAQTTGRTGRRRLGAGAIAGTRGGRWSDDVAIVGLAGRFPGAQDVGQFWDNIVGGVDCVGPVPEHRWDHRAVYDPAPAVPGRTQCPAGGFLDGVGEFDPLMFNMSPNEATLMDPQQRLFLQSAWHALEDAGYAGPHPIHARTGVFVGTVAGDYDDVLAASGLGQDAQRFMGNAASMLAARIAYRLDLHGPCLSIDTACSSSLVAVQLACESLMRGESDMALAGGVAVLAGPRFYIAASQAGMLSPTGHCHTLDEAADGFVPGEASAAIVLKRRADAERDGDRIVALIKGAATNHDGTSNGITAPNGAAQAALIRKVQEDFAVDPTSIGYIELHGTGTRLGDPIEMEALGEAFEGVAGRCALGSVKANIGHTLPAAGIVGLIKVALALAARTIPPTAHLSSLNHHLSLGRFDVPARAEAWPSGGPRRGAVSSFGFSGTNAHAILEEAPPARPLAGGRDVHLAVFSARTEAGLEAQLAAMKAWLAEDRGRTSIADICGTLARGRWHLAHRAAFVVTSAAQLRAVLAGTAEPVAAPADLRDHLASFVAGEAAAFDSLYPDASFRRAALPLYPFERRRCWPASAPARPTELRLPTAPDTPAATPGDPATPQGAVGGPASPHGGPGIAPSAPSDAPGTADGVQKPRGGAQGNGSMSLFDSVIADLGADR